MWFGTISTISPRPAPRRRRHEAPQRVLAAELRIDACRIDHVVAVHRARTRGRDRRRVHVTDAETCDVGDMPLGVRKGEALVELQPHGGARSHARRLRNDASRARASGASRISDAGAPSRRRQFGCSSIVPGTFGCSASPRMSSIGISASGAGDCAVKAIAASTAWASFSPSGSSAATTPALRKARHSAERSFARSPLFAFPVSHKAERVACRDIDAFPPARDRSADRVSSSLRPRRGATRREAERIVHRR